MALARRRLSPTHLALAFINQQPFVTSNLIGATALAQLKENIDSVEVTLPQEALDGIAQIHAPSEPGALRPDCPARGHA